MMINDEQMDFIQRSLAFHGINEGELMDSLMDHIATSIEQSQEVQFEIAYQNAIQQLGGYGALQLMQNDLNEKILIRSFLSRRKIFYLLSCFNMMLLCVGFIFKMNKWPSANILVATGFFILVFGTVPFWFYNRYKLSAHKSILLNR